MLFIVFLYNLLYFYKMSGNIPSFICESFFFLLCWPVQLNVVNFIDLFKEANIGLVDYLIFLLFISLIFFSSFYFLLLWASLVAQLLKNLPSMGETWVHSLGWEDPLEKRKATHSSTLAWRIPCYSPWGRKESEKYFFSNFYFLPSSLDFVCSAPPPFFNVLR